MTSGLFSGYLRASVACPITTFAQNRLVVRAVRFEASVARRHLELQFTDGFRTDLGRVEDRKLTADDLVWLVALDTLRTGVILAAAPGVRVGVLHEGHRGARR